MSLSLKENPCLLEIRISSTFDWLGFNCSICERLVCTFLVWNCYDFAVLVKELLGFPFTILYRESLDFLFLFQVETCFFYRYFLELGFLTAKRNTDAILSMNFDRLWFPFLLVREKQDFVSFSVKD